MKDKRRHKSRRNKGLSVKCIMCSRGDGNGKKSTQYAPASRYKYVLRSNEIKKYIKQYQSGDESW